MKIGIALPNNWGVERPLELVDLAVQAEELGFDSVWASEHLINTAYVQARIGKAPYHHPLATLSFVAARTRRISLGTSILVLPFHHPFDIGKYCATLDQLSGGRLILGIGAGAMKDEFDAMSLPWEKRGLMMDEAIGVMKAIWTQENAEFRGQLYSFSDVVTSPKPYQKPHVPIWVGGMTDAAIRRAALLGNGWHPIAISPDELRAHLVNLRAMREKAGLSWDAFDVCMRFNFALEGQVLMDVEKRSTVSGDDLGEMIDTITTFSAAGVTHFIFAINANEFPVLSRMINRVANEVLPKFR